MAKKKKAAMSAVRAIAPAAPLHRLAQVMEQEGLSANLLARHLGISEDEMHRLMEGTCGELTVSQLRVASLLMPNVPFRHLLEEPGEGICSAIKSRALMIQAMKTVRMLQEKARTEEQKLHFDILVETLFDIMPELGNVQPWHFSHRGKTEMGKIAECIPTNDISLD